MAFALLRGHFASRTSLVVSCAERKQKSKAARGNSTESKTTRSPTAYNLFVKSYASKAKTEQPDVKFTSLLKGVGEKWRALTSDERQVYEEEAHKLKGQLLSTRPQKESSNDKNRPKKPASPYLLFQKESYPTYKLLYPDLNRVGVMAKVAEAWKNVPEEEKAARSHEFKQRFAEWKAATSQTTSTLPQPASPVTPALPEISMEPQPDYYLTPQSHSSEAQPADIPRVLELPSQDVPLVQLLTVAEFQPEAEAETAEVLPDAVLGVLQPEGPAFQPMASDITVDTVPVAAAESTTPDVLVPVLEASSSAEAVSEVQAAPVQEASGFTVVAEQQHSIEVQSFSPEVQADLERQTLQSVIAEAYSMADAELSASGTIGTEPSAQVTPPQQSLPVVEEPAAAPQQVEEDVQKTGSSEIVFKF